MFQLLQSLAITLYIWVGNLCNITPFNQPWSTESYALFKSIHAILIIIIIVIIIKIIIIIIIIIINIGCIGSSIWYRKTHWRIKL